MNSINQHSSSCSIISSDIHENSSSVPPSSIKHTKVLILGGGMAGIAAAKTLQAGGMEDFLLLEAADRLGGRIMNTDFCGHKIEEGANWIHGIENDNNPILLLARECGIKIFEHDDSFSARNSDGRNITEDMKKAVGEFIEAISSVEDKAEERGLTGGEPPPDGKLNLEGPLVDCSLEVAHRELGGWEAKTPEQIAAEWYLHDWDDSFPSTKSSLLGYMHNETYDEYGEGDALVVSSEGYAKIVHHLAAQTFVGGESDPRLLLHETVREVRLCAAGEGECHGESANERVCVRTAEGRTYYARYCIITFSNAVILSGNVRFIPSLPEWKLRALRQCELAAYTKIFLKFADNVRPFWDPTEWILYVDTEEVNGSPVSSTANQPLSATDADKASSKSSNDIDKYNRFRNASAAVSHARKHGARYTRGFYSGWVNLSHEGIYPNSNLLLLILVDEMGKSAELKSDEELKAEITAVLRRMYGKDVPEPIAIHCTKWQNNPLTLGAFHCFIYGTTLADLENLSRPFNSLHFAGDGAGVEYTGCVHGAYNTGVQQAQTVIEKLRDLK